MIKIITGDTSRFTFSIVYSGAVDGLPAPVLDNATVVFALKKDRHTLTKESVQPESNIVSFVLTPEETARMSAGVYEACCKIYYEDGSAVTAWADNVTVIKGVLGADKP